MEKAKRAKLVDEGKEEVLDPKVLETIGKLQQVQDDLEKINEEASDKVLEIEQKYNEVRKPVYMKRGEIISTIPEFWLTSFLSHPVLFAYLNDDDQELFKFLHSINVEDFSDVKSGFSITFNFKDNPYFENNELKKVFKFSEEGNVSITATKIKWKKNMDLTNGKVEETEKDKGSKRNLPKEESFFKWFESFDDAKSAFDNLQDEIADIIKDDLWPNPLKYFAQEGDDDDIDFEEDDDDDEDEDDDDGEDEDEENEDEK